MAGKYVIRLSDAADTSTYYDSPVFEILAPAIECEGSLWVTIPVVLVAAISGFALAYSAFRAHAAEFGTRGDYGLDKCARRALVVVEDEA